MNRRIFLLSTALLCTMTALASGTNEVDISVDFTQEQGEMRPIWSWFGYDEPNYTYMKDGKQLLTEISQLGTAPVYIRAHNLLTTGHGEAAYKWGSTNAYTEDKKGRPVYDWTIVDSIFDTYVTRGLHPLVEIGFMPEALSTHPKPYRHFWKPGDPYSDIYTGWAYPANDYDKWRELIYQWAKHCQERYGEREVSQWWWEVWNEPNYYLQGTFEDYCHIYDYAVDGLKKALPNARVGGPHTTDPSDPGAADYLRRFLQHCESGTNYANGGKGVPIDYIGFHAKGLPRFKNGVVTMDIGRQLRNAAAGFRIVSASEKYRHLPVVIGEFDPEGCAACSDDFNPQNAYRNGTLYSSTVAMTYARLYELTRQYNVDLIGAVTWAFEFEGQKWFGGFRDLFTNGVDKPVLNVYRMFGKMGGKLVKVESSSAEPVDSVIRHSVRKQAEVNALASKQGDQAAILLWNYHDRNITDVAPARVNISIKGLYNGDVTIEEYRIDSSHSNAYSVWKQMGSTQDPSAEQIAQLKKAGMLQMAGTPRQAKVEDGKLQIGLSIERQGVVLYVIKGNTPSLSFEHNQPIGTPQGYKPGRVTLVRDKQVAKWNGKDGNWWDEGNIDQERLDRMYEQSILALTDDKSAKKAWRHLFEDHNQKTTGKKTGYKKGEGIAIKINLNNTFGTNDRDNEIDQSPQATRSLLRQLVNVAGVPQQDIIIYDASRGFRPRAIPDRIYKPLHEEFPQVRWMSLSGSEGVEPANRIEGAISFTSPDVRLGTSLPKAVVEAKYIINAALLKRHEITGFTACAKNHFGSIEFPHMQHNSPTVNQRSGRYGDYSALVDLMGAKNLGRKTMLCIVDGIYGMQTNVGAPRADRDSWNEVFDGGWSACCLMSQDPVAIESVCLDLLFAEFGRELGFSGAPAFLKGSSLHCDNFLIEAARGTNAHLGDYRPDGQPTGSLGVFEHWNNAREMHYERIELKRIEVK